MRSSKDIVTLLEEEKYKVEHGDYQRIANVTKKPNGEPYTADYVRKVLLGKRDNPTIKKIAKLYFKRIQKLQDELKELVSA